jgi:arylsulfatase A-like enzyme
MPTEMSRRSLIQSALASGAVIRGATMRPPNVILMLTDDQGYGDLSCHGNPVLKTPHLDRLHNESVRFTNFHVSPSCAPTRSALMTGRYANATGVWHTVNGRSLLHPEEVTMADCFRTSGYATGIFGKWHLGDNYPCRPQDRGFEEVLVHGGGGVHQTPDYFGNDYFDDTYRHNGKFEKFSGYCTDIWFSNAMNFIQRSQKAERPFFCYLPTNAAHTPFWVPREYEDMYRGIPGLRSPGYFGMIKNIDDNVGKLMRFLRTRGLERDTIVVFLTDNGAEDVGAAVYNAGMRAWKISSYDGGHRVPFFFRWPGGNLGRSRDVNTLTAHIDVLPTLIDLCRLKRPSGPEMHGKSLRPLLTSEQPKWSDRIIVTDSQRGDLLTKWKSAAVMSQQWRLNTGVRKGEMSKLELYDIQKDPGQSLDVAEKYPGVVDRLKDEYEKWWALTSARAKEYVRICIGSEKENPIALTCHDWHSLRGGVPWEQGHIRSALKANGFWEVEIAKSGSYHFEIRRWPREVNLPINALYKDPEFNRDTNPIKAIHAEKARLQIGEFDQTQPVRPEDLGIAFQMQLPAGPTRLQTWFYDVDGTERGAYYIYARRL